MKTKIALLAALATAVSCATSGVKPYTSDECLVSGNKLGSMGTPVTRVYQNQEVKFCCAPCTKKFDKNPEKYLRDLH